jgi:hypothetical protein
MVAGTGRTTLVLGVDGEREGGKIWGEDKNEKNGAPELVLLFLKFEIYFILLLLFF